MNDSNVWITAGIGIIGGIAAAGIIGVAAQSYYILSKNGQITLGSMGCDQRDMIFQIPSLSPLWALSDM